MTRVRRDVATLTRRDDWPEVLVAYERAVGLMRGLDPGRGQRPVEPTSWRFQAAIHGLEGPGGVPDTSNPLWSSCQHGSWFFLPWHRMYLAAFEAIVQHHLGDPDWSLPYWYAIDPDRPRRSVLPAAFRDTERPGGNHLHTRRRARRVNQGRPLHGEVPFEQLSSGLTEALAAGRYATGDGIATFGGGKRSRPVFGGPEQGLLEGTPHGLVHVLVGGADRFGNPGWMGSFYTAALDPVFWLHHANLDRLWQVWLDLGHRVPRGQRSWMDTSFTFPAPGGRSVSWRVRDVLDTRELGYEYDDVSPPSGVAAALGLPAQRAGRADEDDGDIGDDRNRDDARPRAVRVPEVLRLRALATVPTEDTDLVVPPRVLGAVDDVPLDGTDVVVVRLPRGAGTTTVRTYLRVEGVTGAGGAPAYSFWVGVPEGDDPREHPDLLAGTLPVFGVAESSVRSDRHDGDGVTATYDLTAVRLALVAAGRWDDAAVRVSVRAGEPGDDEVEEQEDAEPLPGSLVRSPEGTAGPLRVRRLAVVTSVEA